MTYYPQAGDRIRRKAWPKSDWIDVLYVGETDLFARSSAGAETTYSIDRGGTSWEKVLESPAPPTRHPPAYDQLVRRVVELENFKSRVIDLLQTGANNV